MRSNNTQVTPVAAPTRGCGKWSLLTLSLFNFRWVVKVETNKFLPLEIVEMIGKMIEWVLE